MTYDIEYQLDCLLVDYDKLKKQVFDDRSWDNNNLDNHHLIGHLYHIQIHALVVKMQCDYLISSIKDIL
jgi:hypothetical protein